MIELAGVVATTSLGRGQRAALGGVSLAVEAGILALVGRPLDGTTLLLDVVDGSVAPRAGAVRVLGGTPAAARRRIARVLGDAPLPDALRVAEVCALAAELRGEPARLPAERLAVLDLGALAARRVRSLDVAERRAVTLALALTSSVSVLLVEEPFADLSAPPHVVADALRAFAARAAVVVTTASARDASAIGDRIGRLASGALTLLPPQATPADLATGPASLRIVLADGRDAAADLVRALTADPAIAGVETRVLGAAGALVLARGGSLDEVALAVTRAIASTRAPVVAVQP